MVKTEKCDDMFSRYYNTDHECDRQTDRRTDIRIAKAYTIVEYNVVSQNSFPHVGISQVSKNSSYTALQYQP